MGAPRAARGAVVRRPTRGLSFHLACDGLVFNGLLSSHGHDVCTVHTTHTHPHTRTHARTHTHTKGRVRRTSRPTPNFVLSGQPHQQQQVGRAPGTHHAAVPRSKRGATKQGQAHTGTEPLIFLLRPLSVLSRLLRPLGLGSCSSLTCPARLALSTQ
jgi:hypothetical protein